jgi:hypothetical protein
MTFGKSTLCLNSTNSFIYYICYFNSDDAAIAAGKWLTRSAYVAG